MKMMRLLASLAVAGLLVSPLAAEEAAQGADQCDVNYDSCLEQCEKAEDGSDKCYETCEQQYDACLAKLPSDER
jgi:hypothetical protein